MDLNKFQAVFDTSSNLFTCSGLLPPSLNRTYKSGHGGFYSSKKQKDWKETLSWTCALSLSSKPFYNNSVFVMSRWFLPANGDIDNRIKVLHDGLEAGGVYSNDKLIIRAYQEKVISKKRGFVCTVGPLELFNSCLDGFILP